jgi:hypothetical protein
VCVCVCVCGVIQRKGQGQHLYFWSQSGKSLFPVIRGDVEVIFRGLVGVTLLGRDQGRSLLFPCESRTFSLELRHCGSGKSNIDSGILCLFSKYWAARAWKDLRQFCFIFFPCQIF